MVRVFYKEKFEYKCMVLDMLMPKKKFLAKIKTDSFSKSTSSLCECTFLHSSSPQAAAAAWLHQLKLMTETAIHNF